MQYHVPFSPLSLMKSCDACDPPFFGVLAFLVFVVLSCGRQERLTRWDWCNGGPCDVQRDHPAGLGGHRLRVLRLRHQQHPLPARRVPHRELPPRGALRPHHVRCAGGRPPSLPQQPSHPSQAFVLSSFFFENTNPQPTVHCTLLLLLAHTQNGCCRDKFRSW